MDFEIWIDSLQLNNVPTTDFDRLGRALEAELTRLITAEGLPVRLGSGHVEIEPDVVSAESGISAEALGIEIARSIFSGLSHEGA